VTNPAQNNQTVQQPACTVTANISNVANNQGISCLFNGMPMSSFVFANGAFSANVNLIPGTNNIVLTAVNTCGTDTETIAVNYSAPVDNTPQKVTICHYPPGNSGNPQTIEIPLSAWPAHQAHGDIMGACPQVAPTPPCNPPSIQVTNPTQSGQTVQQTSFNITANISNIANNQGIVYTVNGKPMTSFSFSNGSFSNSVNLNVGINTFTITATNDCGTDTETITINYSAPTPPCNPPSIQVTNPTQNGITVQSANFVFGATISNVSNNQGVVMVLNGKPFVGFAFAPTKGGSLTSSLTLNPGTNMIVVTATNECGTDTETITINYTAPVEQKVVICHKSGNTTQTLEIPMSAWPAHQAHGDVLGPCPTQKPNENGGQQQNNGSGNQQPVKPEIKPATRGGNGETEAEPKEEENKEINKPGEGKVQGKGRG
jgi:PKD repeat protein